jgi:hypothetical protein
MDRQEGDLAGCDDNPSLLVILQPSGGGAILAAGEFMSRKLNLLDRAKFVLAHKSRRKN